MDAKDAEIAAYERQLEKESALQLRNFRAGLISATGGTRTLPSLARQRKTLQKQDEISATHLKNGVFPGNLNVSASTTSTTPSSLTDMSTARKKFGFEDPFLNSLLSAK